MVGYINELLGMKNLDSYKIVWGDEVIWIANYIKIIEYSKERVKLKVKNNVLIIEGCDISIDMLEKKELMLKGKINNVYLEKPFKVDEVL